MAVYIVGALMNFCSKNDRSKVPKVFLKSYFIRINITSWSSPIKKNISETFKVWWRYKNVISTNM
jgi:hypothetical protein